MQMICFTGKGRCATFTQAGLIIVGIGDCMDLRQPVVILLFHLIILSL